MIGILATAISGEALDVRVTVEPLGELAHVAFTVVNAGAAAVEGWAIDVALPAAVAGVHGAMAIAVGATRYRLSPDAWRSVLGPGESASLGVLVPLRAAQITTA